MTHLEEKALEAAMRPVEVGGLVERLRESAEELPTNSPAAINYREAATALEAQAAELAAVHQRYVDANEARIDAEAALAEARKALEGATSRGCDHCADSIRVARRALTGGQNG